MPPASPAARPRPRGHLWLVGMMGVGKSTVARLVGERLGWPVVDLDRRVERDAGRPLTAIFASDGEPGFRVREAAALAALADEPEGLVVATGGGAPCFADGMTRMERSGLVVWLRASADEVWGGLDASARPLLNLGGDPRARWLELAAERRATYARAELAIDRAARSAEQVADELCAFLRDHGEAPLAVPLVPSVEVALGARAYPVFLDTEEGSAPRFAARLARRFPPGRHAVAVITDENVAGLHLPRYRAALAERGFTVAEAVVPAGEASKSMAQAEALLVRLAAAGLDRGALVVALGGGVIGDLAGFAAALYLRGVALVQVPTTLLAMVDSSVGGKTGVNLPAGKNLVGAFHQPSLVWADLPSLATLPPRELSAGLGEVAKHALLEGPGALAALEAVAAAARAGDPATLAELVAASVRLKAQVVAGDERELDPRGGRMLLNLGHTVGHALESESLTTAAPLRHGEAVGLGLVAAARVAAALARSSAAPTEPAIDPPVDPPVEPGLEARLSSLLLRLGLPADLDGALARLPGALPRLQADKKRAAGELRYVALGAPGAPRVIPLSPARLAALLHRPPRSAIGTAPEATP